MPINQIKRHHLRQFPKYEVSKPGPDQIRKVTADVTEVIEEVVDERGNIIITDDPTQMHSMMIDPKSPQLNGDTLTTQTGQWDSNSTPKW